MLVNSNMGSIFSIFDIINVSHNVSSIVNKKQSQHKILLKLIYIPASIIALLIDIFYVYPYINSSVTYTYGFGLVYVFILIFVLFPLTLLISILLFIVLFIFEKINKSSDISETLFYINKNIGQFCVLLIVAIIGVLKLTKSTSDLTNANTQKSHSA
jgi:hypothetical protein